jgi:ATP-dependent exoDNAse (exonuclease V) beta subunit
MQPPKTPKNSGMNLPPPKTPKHAKSEFASAKSAKRRRDRPKTEDIKGKKTPKRVKSEKGAGAIEAAAVVPTHTGVVPTHTGGVSTHTAKKKNVAPRKTPLPPLKTDIDDVDIASLVAQYTRARATGKLSLSLMESETKNGLVDIAEISSIVQDVLSQIPHDESANQITIAQLAEKVPINKMRFSKKAINFTQMLAEKIFCSKVRDIHNMNLITNKQTITLDTVWAERNYNYKKNDYKSNQTSVTADLPGSMIEDVLIGCTENTSPSNASIQTWLECERMHARFNDQADLVDIAIGIYGRDGPWKAVL